jgi:phage gp16-like protein
MEPKSPKKPQRKKQPLATTSKASYAQKQRNAMLAKINIAKTQLFDDDTYRAMLQNVIGTNSCKNATTTQLQQVIDYMTTHGATLTNRSGYGKKPNNIDSTSTESCAPLLQKIEAQLTDMGLPWGYITSKGKKAVSMLEQLTGKQKLEWCTDKELQKIIAALSYAAKRKKKAEVKSV